MALTTTTTPVSNPVQEQPSNNAVAEASLLSMLVLTMYAANKSKKELRKLKRKFLWTSFKLKIKSLFSGKKATDRQILLYILIGVLALALILVSPIAALIVAMLGLVLILTGTI
jgi:hypothetical protein